MIDNNSKTVIICILIIFFLSLLVVQVKTYNLESLSAETKLKEKCIEHKGKFGMTKEFRPLWTCEL